MEEQRDFLQEFDKALKFLNDGNKLQILEQAVNNYIGSNADLSLPKFINFQMHLNELVGEHINVISHYFQEPMQFQYNGQFKQAFRRVEALKSLIHIHWNLISAAMVAPNRLKGNFFSFNETSPSDLLVTLINNDNNCFTTNVDFNGGLNLVNQLLENLTDKMNKGSNNIDIGTYEKFKSNADTFISRMEELTSTYYENAKK